MIKSNEAIVNMEVLNQTLILKSTNFEKVELCVVKKTFSSSEEISNFFLHEEELIFFSNQLAEKRRDSYLLGRICAKYAISRYLNIKNLKDIYIRNGIHQQPVVYYKHIDKVQVSITHSGDIAASLAFSELYPIGIDLEQISTDFIPAIEQKISLEEMKFENLFYCQKEKMFTLFWTVKESISKAIKTGLVIPFEHYEITNLKFCNYYYTNDFKYFPQYKAISFQINNYFISIVYPKKTLLVLTELAIKNLSFFIN